ARTRGAGVAAARRLPRRPGEDRGVGARREGSTGAALGSAREGRAPFRGIWRRSVARSAATPAGWTLGWARHRLVAACRERGTCPLERSLDRAPHLPLSERAR